MTVCARPACTNQFQPAENHGGDPKKYCSKSCRTRNARNMRGITKRVQANQPICDNPYKLLWTDKQKADEWARYQTLRGNHQQSYLCRGCNFWHVYTVKQHRKQTEKERLNAYSEKYPLLFPKS